MQSAPGNSSIGAPPAKAERWAASWIGGACLVLLCLSVYGPGLLTIPPVDRDEARFAQASRQMLESGDWVVPRVQDRPRLVKPPLIYWLQAGTAWALTGGDAARDAIWMYRLPSVFAALGTVLLTWRLGLSMFAARGGTAGGPGALGAWLGAAGLGVCPVFAWEAHQARADHVLVACTALGAWMLWLVWSRAAQASPPGHAAGARPRPGARRPPMPSRTLGPAVVLWIAAGLGILAKGPITPMVLLLTAAALSLGTGSWRWVRATRPALGLGIVLALTLPWVVAVGQRVGWAEYAEIVRSEVLDRGISPKEGHWGPPGYHLLLMVVLLWPCTMLTGVAVADAWRRARVGGGAPTGEPPTAADGRAPATGGVRRARFRACPELFCLAWAAPAWVVFELAGTKLPHYTMPLYPPLALLSAAAAVRADRGELALLAARAAKIGLTLWPLIGIAALAGVAAVLVKGWARPASPDQGALLVACGVAAMIAVGAQRRALDARRFVRAMGASLALAAALWAAVVGVLLPRAGALWLSRDVAAIVARVDPRGERAVAAAGFHEDSLIFHTRGRAERIGTEAVRTWLRDHPGGIVVTRPEAFAEDADDLRSARVLGVVEGFNYSQGRVETLFVLEASDAGEGP